MSAAARQDTQQPLLQVIYQPEGEPVPPGREVLADLSFGPPAPGAGKPASAPADARRLRVALSPLCSPAKRELWTVPGPVRHGRSDGLAWAHDAELQFVALECPVAGDIRRTAASAYATLRGFLHQGEHRHVLRVWNYLDAITAGCGDDERYRQFCVGRAEGMGGDWGSYPAATAIGRSHRCASATLQVYALSARAPGVPLENPRQVAAYRYPREYGPQAPSFARAMRDAAARLPLMLSGTASVVGHASAHVGSLERQVEETCTNLERLLARARELDPTLPERFGPASMLKVYLRQPEAAAAVRAQLLQRFPGSSLLLLEAEVCRRELLVEIDGFHGC